MSVAARTRELASDSAVAGVSARGWHVSALVDSLAYHWSWVPALLVLWFGSVEEDHLLAYLVILGVGFSHRHLTLPYVYLDGQVLRRHPLRFTILPGAMLALFLLAPLLDRTPFIAVAATVAGGWNMWHVYMQKYGILRMYAAKAGPAAGLGSRAAALGDRALVLCWLPLCFAWLGPKHRDMVLSSFRTARPLTEPLLDGLARIQPWFLPLSVALLAVAMVSFALREWRANRFGVRPRALMALGTTALSASFLVFDPEKVYLAFGFSHAIEYSVFVWAFQRRRYAEPLPHRPPLQHLLRRPWLYFAVIVVGLGALYTVLVFWGSVVGVGRAPLTLAGVPSDRWIFYWAIFQSIVHFYFDGFLWKMRLPSVRASI